MTDDRDFNQYRWENKNITFKEYVKMVLANQPARSEELQNLLKVHSAEALEKMLEDKPKVT